MGVRPFPGVRGPSQSRPEPEARQGRGPCLSLRRKKLRLGEPDVTSLESDRISVSNWGPELRVLSRG